MPGLWKGRTGEVFSDLLRLAFYDGTVTLVCRCTSCSTPHLISVVSWQPSRSIIRVFGVSRITVGEFEKIVALDQLRVRAIEGGASELDPSYEAAITQLLRQAKPPTAVLASIRIEEEILAGLAIAESEIAFCEFEDLPSDPHFHEWLARLGLKETRGEDT